LEESVVKHGGQGSLSKQERISGSREGGKEIGVLNQGGRHEKNTKKRLFEGGSSAGTKIDALEEKKTGLGKARSMVEWCRMRNRMGRAILAREGPLPAIERRRVKRGC